MGDSYRDELRKAKARSGYSTRSDGDRQAREQRSQALKRQQSRPKSLYGKKATQLRLLDA